MTDVTVAFSGPDVTLRRAMARLLLHRLQQYNVVVTMPDDETVATLHNATHITAVLTARDDNASRPTVRIEEAAVQVFEAAQDDNPYPPIVYFDELHEGMKLPAGAIIRKRPGLVEPTDFVESNAAAALRFADESFKAKAIMGDMVAALSALMFEYVPGDDSENDPKSRRVIRECEGVLLAAGEFLGTARVDRVTEYAETVTRHIDATTDRLTKP